LAEIGQTLDGRYRLIELLGQGGMATIYRAADTGLGRDVALKLLRPEYLRDPDFSSRFRQEAQAAASLSHPNVVTVFDYGEDPSGPYIAMELVDGEDLATILKRSGALPPRQAARIAAGVARALAAAHAKGLIHRDVKPGNVLIGRDGRVKVVDFGIARAVAEAQMTLPGTTLGSVHYFSPEQARGETTTEASDIYSLGIVLYELLTGVRPWTGDSAASVALARLSGPVPDPIAVRSAIPPDLAAITRKALAAAPRERFASAEAMAESLETALAGQSGLGPSADTPAGAVRPSSAGPAAGAAAPRSDRSPAGTASGSAVVAAAGAAGAAAAGAAARPGSAAISGTARANPVRVPYPPEAYAGGADEDVYTSATARRRAAARSTQARRPAYEDDIDDGGTSPVVWLTGIVAIALLAAVAFLVYQFASGGDPGSSNPPELVTVPNFVGDSIADANQEAAELGIVLEGTPRDDGSEPGFIREQDTAPGTEIAVGDTVRVVFSAPSGDVRVPELRFKTVAEAGAALVELGLNVGTAGEAFDPVVPAGSVSGQSPEAGEPVPLGTQVLLTISKGPEPSASPSASPSPSPSPSPTPTPTPTPTPEPTPLPTPEPTPTPEPPPTPEPTPEPTPVPPAEASPAAP
jgi:tRNA A-37 threonylcarbamoyl transferase component Bud32